MSSMLSVLIPVTLIQPRPLTPTQPDHSPAPPTLHLLTAPPPALTPAQLAVISTATPSSFQGIDPLLRHKEDNVTVFIDPPFPGLGGEHEAKEGIEGELWITEG